MCRLVFPLKRLGTLYVTDGIETGIVLAPLMMGDPGTHGAPQIADGLLAVTVSGAPTGCARMIQK
ncbi:MAG: hypothetical protein Kow0074_23830 [Candidatus Zixiibacteriota bacterium]